MVALLEPDGQTWWGCGGALIAPNKVLTAAHCVYSGSQLQVLIGAKSITSASNCPNHEVIRVSEVDVNSRYNSGTMDYDMAMLTLERESNLKPAKYVRNASHADGQSVLVAGFGATSEGGNVSVDQLMEVEVTTNTEDPCKANYDSLGWPVLDSMFCASDQSPNQDSCQGDSGGPVYKFNTNTKEATHLGIVSWGYGCARTDYPGVYAKTTADNDFMKKHGIPGSGDGGEDP